MNEIEFTELLENIATKKKRIYLSFCFSFLVGISYYLLSETRYESYVLAIDKTQQSQSSMLSELPLGLLGAAPISGDTPDYVIEKIYSKDFFKFLSSNNPYIYANFYAFESYDAQEGVSFDNTLYDPEKKSLKPEAFSDYRINFNSAYKIYKRVLSVDFNPTTRLFKISTKHGNPEFAQYLSTKIIQSVNTRDKEVQLAEANLFIKYLQKERNNAQVQDIKNSMNLLITEQIEKKAKLNSTPYVTLNTIESAYIPEKPSDPNLIAILGIVLFFGTLISFFSVLFRK